MECSLPVSVSSNFLLPSLDLPMPDRRSLVLACAALFAAGPPPARQALPVAAPNDNRVAAGTLRDGALDISLEVTRAMWHPDGDSLPGLPVEAFAEAGRAPSAPGPDRKS